MRTLRDHLPVLTALAVTLVAYTLTPAGVTRDLAYDGIGALCAGIAFAGLRRTTATRRAPWRLVILGFLGWVVGDALFSVQTLVLHLTIYPAPSDALYLGSYALVGAGLLQLVRRRGARGDLPAVLDAAIFATGVAVVAGVFVLAPIAQDSSLDVAGKVVSSMYPVADVLLLGILVRLWATPGSRTASFRLLLVALSLNLVGDVVYNVTTLTGGTSASLPWNDLLWLASYVLMAGATWSPAVHELGEQPGGLVEDPHMRRRLVVLTGGLLLPALALLGDGLDGQAVAWPVVATGGMVLSLLVLARMVGLLSVVQSQAVQLAALARSDPLTGAPNRRTWDHELSRACQAAREQGSQLVVALLDLDHFKRFNDRFGHPTGDLLLREATAVWIDLLGDAGLLARYGGEEFAVLLPGHSLDEAERRLCTLLAATPRGQTFSAGLAVWDDTRDPATAVAAADAALYEAKRGGRNRVCAAGRTRVPALARPRIALQPIVDLRTRQVVAVEALSRFEGRDPAEVFRSAHEAGRGPELEAAAVRGARGVHPGAPLLSVNIALESLGEPVVREALAGDLRGVALEITEHDDLVRPDDVLADVAAYRARGAVIAIDDWGRGFSNLDRLLLLRPEIVKLDMSLIRHLDSPYHRATISSVVSWADAVETRVCAEGIEHEHEWHQLRALGVHLGQGYLFGRPQIADPVGRRLSQRPPAA